MSLSGAIGGLDQGRPRLPALGFATLLAGGIFFAKLAPSLWYLQLLLVAASSVLFFLFRTRRQSVIFAELTFCFLVTASGFLLFTLQERFKQLKPSHLPTQGEDLVLVGTLVGVPWETRGYAAAPLLHFPFQVEAYREADSDQWVKAHCRIMVSVPGGRDLELSGNERLAMIALLRQPRGYANPGGFDRRNFLAGRGIAAEAFIESPEEIAKLESSVSGSARLFDPLYWANGLRARLFGFHREFYHEKGVQEVASAMLIGAREQVPYPLREDFALSGTIHVLVVSGLHVGFIAGAAYLLFSLLFGRGLATSLISVFVVLLFALISGGRPSVMRRVAVTSPTALSKSSVWRLNAVKLNVPDTRGPAMPGGLTVCLSRA